MIKRIYIPGLPLAKMRPRSTRNGHMYDPNAENTEASLQKAQISGEPRILKGALSVTFEFVFPRPKNHFRTGKNSRLLKDSAPFWCMVSKDLDNMEKFYADAFNSIAYADDRQIVKMSSVKRWADEGEFPFVEMKITALEPEKEGEL